MGSADKTLQTELKRQNAGGEQLRHARLRCADEGFTTCTNLRLGLSVQAKSSLNFRESLLLCAPPSYATRLLPVCIISWAPLEKKKKKKKKHYKHYTVCQHCLKTQRGEHRCFSGMHLQ